MRFSTTSLLTVSALTELTAGIALSIVPSATTHLLLGVGLASAESALVARIAGAALLAIGLVCWIERGREGYGARNGLVTGLLVYNAVVVILLVWSAVVDKMHGLALWPAIVAHAALFAWCALRLRFHWPTRMRAPT
jgi:hypothetical protein